MNWCRGLAVSVLVLLSSACTDSDYYYMREGEPFAVAIARDLTQNWDATQLVEKADPDMLREHPESEMREWVAECARRLGSVKEESALAGEVHYEGIFRTKSAVYIFSVKGEKANARMKIALQKHENGWKVVGFGVQG